MCRVHDGHVGEGGRNVRVVGAQVLDHDLLRREVVCQRLFEEPLPFEALVTFLEQMNESLLNL